MAFKFVADNLAPGERLGEVLFGLIMTLTFTLGAGMLFGAGEGAGRELLIATLGCNVAWGVIDGALYILGLLFDRGRLGRLGRSIASTTDDQHAVALVASELDETLVPITSPDARLGLYRDIVARVKSGERRPVALGLGDFKAAAVVFWSVVITTLPAAAPFVFIRDPWIALRVSNALLIVVLFFVGFRWAKHTSLSAWTFALGLTTFGVALVLLAIALGG